MQASRQPSGENVRDLGITFTRLGGSLRSDTLPRVVESWTPTLSSKQTAMNLPQGDQAASLASVVPPRDAAHESHESGIPFVTLAGELISWPYNSRTTDDFGASRSAEW